MQLQSVSIFWGLWNLGRLWAVTIEGRTHPQEADEGRKGPGAEGLVESQCRGFNIGKSTVVLAQGVVQEVSEQAQHRGGLMVAL